MGSQVSTSGSSTSLRKVAVFLLLFVVVLVFIVRGPVRAVQSSSDFSVYYCCARVWIQGADPYDGETLEFVAREAGGAPEIFLRNALSAPMTFVLLAPFAFLPWEAGKTAWMCVNIICTGFALLGLLQLCETRTAKLRKIILCTLVLGLAPVHTSIGLGQLTIVVLASLVWGAVCAIRKKQVWAGVLFALATALKPQCGALFLVYFLLRKKWRIFFSGAVVVGILLAVGIARLEMSGVDWVSSLRANHEAFFAGGSGDVTIQAHRHQFLHLEGPIYVLFQNRLTAKVLPWVLTAIVATLLLLALRRLSGQRDELLMYSIVSVVTLVPFYHRVYDAALLSVPLAWALGTSDPRSRRIRIATLVLILPFLVPGPAMLYRLNAGGYVPEWARSSWVWENLILPYQAYLVFALVGVLSLTLLKAGRGRRFSQLAFVMEPADTPADTT